MSESVINEIGDIVDLHFVRRYGIFSRIGLQGIAQYPVLYKINSINSKVPMFAWEVDRCWDDAYSGHAFEYQYLQELLLRKLSYYNKIFMFEEESEKWN